LWDVESKSNTATFTSPSTGALYACHAVNEQIIICGGIAGVITAFDVRTNSAVFQVQGAGGAINTCSSVADTVMFGSENGSIVICDIRQLKYVLISACLAAYCDQE